MHRIIRSVEERSMHSFSLDFRTQTAMHKPLLKPNCSQSARRHFAQQRRDVWTTKRAKADLARLVVVRVAVVKGRAGGGENEESMQVALEQNVHVNPLSDVGAGTHVTRHWVNHVWR